MKSAKTQIIIESGLDINNNFYSEQCLLSIAEQINSGGIKFGELNAGVFSKEIHMNNVSHEVLNAKVDNNLSLFVDINILDTPSGNKLKELLSNKKQVSFGCRGFGNVDEHKNVTNYECIAVNAVYDEQQVKDEDC